MNTNGPQKPVRETIKINSLEYAHYCDKVGELIEVKPGDWRMLAGIQYVMGTPGEFEKFSMEVMTVEYAIIQGEGFSA